MRRRVRDPVAPVGTAWVGGDLVAASGCNASSAASCDELRAELASLDVPKAAEAWEDIAVLQEDVSRALSLQASIDQRCGEGG